ncbi:MAG TPA: hypothetical protein VFZ69_12200 [Longimicrobiales bacterium]
MANTDRRGGSSWIPVAVAVVAVAAFMGWLATREPPESVAVREPGDTTADTLGGGAMGPAEAIDPGVLVQNSSSYVGRVVAIESVPVQDVLGARMFWIELPGGSPYLVRMDQANIAAGAPLPATGSTVRVVGTVRQKDAALIEQWATSDSLTDDQRMLADFGGTFIEARVVESAGS